MDQLSKSIKIQMLAFIIVTVVSLMIVGIGYVKLPAMLFGVGRYSVTVELPVTGGLYPTGNVSYRGTGVGKVESVNLTDTGVEAVLSMDSGVKIPSDLDVGINSQTAIGEQYVSLSPRNVSAEPLRNGDVISRDRVRIPPRINQVLDATNRGLRAIPNDDLKTTIDESYVALSGLGPDFSRFVNGSTTLAIDAKRNLDELTALIDGVGPILDSQGVSSDAIRSWASNLATIGTQLKDRDEDLAGVLEHGAGAADEFRRVFERLQPTLPVVLANLVALGKVAITYQAHIEQVLVLVPQGTASFQGALISGRNTRDYPGFYLSFNTNINSPPPCATGFLPVRQQRPPSLEDYPDRPDADLYCRIPQDSMWNVRGVRNTPCANNPAKRAPTVAMCESDEEYVPLNDGQNWKGDPNATLSGQDIPQLPPGSAPAAPPAPAFAVAEYETASGKYMGPDGRVRVQADLAETAPDQTWQKMLEPPTK